MLRNVFLAAAFIKDLYIVYANGCIGHFKTK